MGRGRRGEGSSGSRVEREPRGRRRRDSRGLREERVKVGLTGSRWDSHSGKRLFNSQTGRLCKVSSSLRKGARRPRYTGPEGDGERRVS